MRPALLALGAALVAGAALADAPTRVAVKPAAKAFGFLADYYKLAAPERSRFALAYSLQEKGRPSPARASLVDQGVETPLPTSPDGWITRLPGPEALARGAQVKVVIPEGSKPAMTMIPEARLPAGSEVSVADLEAASDQVAAVAKRVAGPLSFVFPKFNRVLFSGAQGAEAVDGKGQATPLPLWRGTPALDLAARGDARTVRFRTPPYHALLAPPSKER